MTSTRSFNHHLRQHSQPRDNLTTNQEEAIVEPHGNDVLYGRGGATNQHRGNILWRALVEANKESYVQRSTRDKTLTSKSIVLAIRHQNPPGRFLKQDPASGLWFDVGDNEAQKKTSQALREGAPRLRATAPTTSSGSTTSSSSSSVVDSATQPQEARRSYSPPYPPTPTAAPPPPPLARQRHLSSQPRQEVELDPSYPLTTAPRKSGASSSTESDSLESIYRSGMQSIKRQQVQPLLPPPPSPPPPPSDSLMDIFASAIESDVNFKSGLRVTVENSCNRANAPQEFVPPSLPPQLLHQPQQQPTTTHNRPISNRSLDFAMDDVNFDEEDSVLSNMFQSMMSLMSVTTTTSIGTFDFDDHNSTITSHNNNHNARGTTSRIPSYSTIQWESTHSVMDTTWERDTEEVEEGEKEKDHGGTIRNKNNHNNRDTTSRTPSYSTLQWESTNSVMGTTPWDRAITEEEEVEEAEGEKEEVGIANVAIAASTDFEEKC